MIFNGTLYSVLGSCTYIHLNLPYIDLHSTKINQIYRVASRSKCYFTKTKMEKTHHNSWTAQLKWLNRFIFISLWSQVTSLWPSTNLLPEAEKIVYFYEFHGHFSSHKGLLYRRRLLIRNFEKRSFDLVSELLMTTCQCLMIHRFACKHKIKTLLKINFFCRLESTILKSRLRKKKTNVGIHHAIRMQINSTNLFVNKNCDWNGWIGLDCREFVHC